VGAFLLQVGAFLLQVGAFLLQVGAFLLQVGALLLQVGSIPLLQEGLGEVIFSMNFAEDRRGKLQLVTLKQFKFLK